MLQINVINVIARRRQLAMTDFEKFNKQRLLCFDGMYIHVQRF